MPVLVFEGERDLRTPLSNGAALAARFPQGHLVTVPGVGHSVLGTDLTSCTQNAVATWLSGGVPPSRCPRSPLLVSPIGAFPASLGVKCALPNRPVLCFTGDGGFYYHISELETAARFVSTSSCW